MSDMCAHGPFTALEGPGDTLRRGPSCKHLKNLALALGRHRSAPARGRGPHRVPVPYRVPVPLQPTALVPLKLSTHAKARLSHRLDAAQRMELVGVMFEHVAGVLSDVGLRTVVVCADPLLATAPRGVEVWAEHRRGLNIALEGALRRLEGPALVVPADLPWLGTQDVDGLLAVSGDVVVARARDGGTNALLLRGRVRPAFGPGSALAHAYRARRAGLSARVVRIAGFDDDLDDETTLQRAVAGAPALHARDAARRGQRR